MMDFLRDYWHLLLPPLAGFAAIYVLLPKARRAPAALGAMLAGLALVVGGVLLFRQASNWAEHILFYTFSGLALAGGGLVLAQRNPVYAALSFALVVLAVCGLFLLNAAPFLMAATIIIYAGAIVVTFLFVIMLAQQAGPSSADARTREPFLACVAGFVLVGAILCVLDRTYSTREIDELLAQVQAVAQARTLDDVNKVLGNPTDRSPTDKVPPLVKQLMETIPDTAFDNLSQAWVGKKGTQDLAEITKKARIAYQRGRELRLAHGSLHAPANVPVSHLSGVPASEAPGGPRLGAHERLPAGNVANLGRSLFTDYLVPVQMAAAVLLVATIGAIAIAGRRPEGLR